MSCNFFLFSAVVDVLSCLLSLYAPLLLVQLEPSSCKSGFFPSHHPLLIGGLYDGLGNFISHKERTFAVNGHGIYIKLNYFLACLIPLGAWIAAALASTCDKPCSSCNDKIYFCY